MKYGTDLMAWSLVSSLVWWIYTSLGSLRSLHGLQHFPLHNIYALCPHYQSPSQHCLSFLSQSIRTSVLAASASLSVFLQNHFSACVPPMNRKPYLTAQRGSTSFSKALLKHSFSLWIRPPSLPTHSASIASKNMYSDMDQYRCSLLAISKRMN